MAGHPNKTGYWQVMLDRKSYLAHRIIWKWMTGDDPPQLIDHINHDTHDNRWENLRLAAFTENSQNSRGRGKYKKGVYKNSCGAKRLGPRSPWRASVIFSAATRPKTRLTTLIAKRLRCCIANFLALPQGQRSRPKNELDLAHDGGLQKGLGSRARKRIYADTRGICGISDRLLVIQTQFFSEV